MNLVYLAGLLLSFAAVLFLEHKHRSVFGLFFLGLLFNIGLPVSIDLIDSDTYLEWVIADAAAYVIAFNIIYIIARIVFVRVLSHKACLFDQLGAQIRNLANKRLAFQACCLGVVGILILSYGMASEAGGVMAATWTDGMELSTGLSFSGWLLITGSSAVSLVLLLQRNYFMMSGILVMQIFVVLLTGTRAIVPGIIFPFMIYAYKVRWKYWAPFAFSLLAVSPLLLLVLQMFRWATGTYGMSSFDLGTWVSMMSEQLVNPLETSEVFLRRVFYDIITWNNAVPGFMEGITYRRLLFLPIPSALIPELKPPDFSWLIYQTYYGRSGIEGGSLHPTFFGDAFGNFGWYGVLLGVFWAAAFTTIEKLLLKLSPLLRVLCLGPISIFCLLMARGAIYMAGINVYQMLLFFVLLKAVSMFNFMLPGYSRTKQPQTTPIRQPSI